MKRRALLRRPSQLLARDEILEQVLAVAVGGVDTTSPDRLSPDRVSPTLSTTDINSAVSPP